MATLSAWTAHYLADFTTAVERWADIRRRFPGNVVGYTGAGTTLLALHRDDEAEALIGQAIVLFPNNVHVAMDYARLPQHKRDWDEGGGAAGRRSTSAFRPRPMSMAGYCQMLMTAERWDQAETLLQAAVTQHGGEMWALRSFAESATHRADWAGCRGTLAKGDGAFSLTVRAAGPGWQTCCGAPGGWTSARALLARAIQLIPDNVDLERQRAQIATLRRDWPEALRLWDDLRRKHPRHQGVLNAIKQALWQARQDLGVAAKRGQPRAVRDTAGPAGA